MLKLRNFQMIWVGLILLIGLNYSKGERNIPPEIRDKIDGYIENYWFPTNNISGLVLSVVRDNGEILYTNGYGQANIEKGIQNGNDTQFLIASVTKSFTSVLVAKVLHEAYPELGEAALDTPIRTLIPQINFTLIDRFRSEYATFRDLLAHRLCLARDDLQLSSEPFNSTWEVAYRTKYDYEVCSVRTSFQYNNQLYVLAGELAGVIANKSFEAAMQDLFDDLGMRNSTFLKKSDNFTEMPNRAMPYYVLDGAILPMNEDLVKRAAFLGAAAGLFTTPNDMSRYLRFHLNHGELDGRQIIPKEVMEWLYKLSFWHPMHAFKKEDGDVIMNYFGYGLGVMLASYDGWQVITHGGHITPYLSEMTLYPQKKLGIFSSTNMKPISVDHSTLHAFIFEVLRDSESPTEKAEQMEAYGKWKLQNRREKAKIKMEKFFNKRKLNGLFYEKVDPVGRYGSGSSGDLEVMERFREETNQTEYWLEHGLWYKGWLYECDGCGEGVYKIEFEGDIVQDLYAERQYEIDYFIVFEEGIVEFMHPFGYFAAKFVLGQRMEDLPEVPWIPGSCGPE